MAFRQPSVDISANMCMCVFVSSVVVNKILSFSFFLSFLCVKLTAAAVVAGGLMIKLGSR